MDDFLCKYGLNSRSRTRLIFLGNTQAAVNYMLSVSHSFNLEPNAYKIQEITVFNLDFPSDASDVKFRAVQWICTEVMLALAVLLNLLPRMFIPPLQTSLTHPARYFRYVFYLSSTFVMLDFILNIIWLPIGTAKTYGFRTADQAFMTTYNGTGAPPGWNWCLSYLATAGILIGFDASGHVAEETKNASVNAAKGIFWSTFVSGIGGFLTVILFLFCVVS